MKKGITKNIAKNKTRNKAQSSTGEFTSISSKAEIRLQNERLILESAEKIFAIHGFKGSSTMQIAKEAGLPKANIHYYYKTKANLYAQVLENTLMDWMRAARMFKTHDDPAVTLTNYIGAKMDLARERPYASKVWANEIISGAPIVKKELATTLKAWVEECEMTINDWVAAKIILPVDARTLPYMIWATTQHYADFDSQIVALNDGKRLSDKSFEEKKREIIRLVLTGLGLHSNK